MDSLKIYVVGEMKHYANFISNATLCKKLSDANIVLFTGGEDVDPSLYGKKRHPRTHSNLQRDTKEKNVFDKVRPNQLCIGICRGSQFLCVMNGGILVQDCAGHALWQTHAITNGSLEFQITSTHHQMQYPYNLPKENYEVLYKAFQGTGFEGDGIDVSKIVENGEPEIVLYHTEGKPKCLAIQGHPEMMPSDSAIITEINNIIKNLL